VRRAPRRNNNTRITKTIKAAGRREPERMTRKAKFPRSYIKEASRIDIGDINRHLLFALITTFMVGSLCYPETPHEFFAGNRRCDHDHEENVNVELRHL
jgi:hypothetical protein